MEMGQRWATRLPGLLTDEDRTEVRSSTKSRCIESSKSFTTGIFGNYFEEIIEDNHLLRYYNDCQMFQDEVEENEETFVESNNFIASPYFQEMVGQVNTRSGVPLDVAQVILIWEMCRYEEAWVPSGSSPWCSLF